MGSLSTIGRTAAVLAVLAVIGAVAYAMFFGPAYTVDAEFENAGQLVEGSLVQVAGSQIGTVESIKITPDAHAQVKMKIDDDRFAPLRRGTRAEIRQSSLSGIANRYVSLRIPPANQSEEIASGGQIALEQTDTQVDLDALFDTLDPVARVVIQQFFANSEEMVDGRGQEIRDGLKYLNPSLSTSTAVFSELNRDTPLLAEFIQTSADLTSTLHTRRDELTDLITHFNTTLAAIGNKRGQLQESFERFPGVLRTANTTFVNVRDTLDEVDPLIEATKPVAKKLPPFFAQVRPTVRDARPTIRDLSNIVRRPPDDSDDGPEDANDLVELNRTFPALARTALDDRDRNGENRDGAFEETREALDEAAPIIASTRPYGPDLVGWFDDFSNRGANDALGGFSRAQVFFDLNGELGALLPSFDALLNPFRAGITAALTPVVGAGPAATLAGQLIPTIPDILGLLGLVPGVGDAFEPLDSFEFKRCPGGADAPADDESNQFSVDERNKLNCVEEDRAVDN